MEGVRQIALAYYHKASEEEKDKVEEVFREVDINGDGFISVSEFKSYTSTKADPCLSAFFHLLDDNGDGMLDIFDTAVYFYIQKYDLCSGWRNCQKCFCVLLSGPFFSCSLCEYPDTYDLCCACYHADGTFEHKHSYEYFKDSYSSLGELRGKKPKITNGKNAIEELRDIAMCHYHAGSPDVQKLAYEFFKSMDYNGDETIDLHEFLEFLRQEGYAEMSNSRFFSELDHDGNGTLDFSEVMTLYYIIKSKRTFCNCCGKFIPGVYFICVDCFNISGASFTLCCDCYRNPLSRYRHDHDGRTQFLDNYTLLQAQKVVSPTLVNNQNERVVYKCNEPSYTSVQGHQHPGESSYAIVPARNPRWEKSSTALKLFEVAVQVANLGIASASCTIL